jgi:general secretion pathway protein K
MPPRPVSVVRRQRGFALLIVLWTMGLLALIGTQVTAAGHGEAKLASNLRASAEAQTAADSAVEVAAMHLLDGTAARWLPDGAPYVLRLPQATVTVAIQSEERKLPLNTAPTTVMAALLHVLGLDSRAAQVLAAQIADWRSPANFPLRLGAKAPQYRAAGRLWGPPNRPFRNADELQLVLSMTPAIYARLAPFVTVYTQSMPATAQALPAVAAALTQIEGSGFQPLSFDEPPVMHIQVVALGTAGARFTRDAVIRVNVPGLADPGSRPFDVLAWSQGYAG